MAHLFSSLRSALMPLVMKTRGAPAYMLHRKLIPLGGNMQLNTCACDDMCVNRKHIYIYIYRSDGIRTALPGRCSQIRIQHPPT